MERELRRFGERAAEHQKQDRQVERRAADLRAAGQDLAQLIGARGLAQQQHPGDQRHATGAGHDQGHACPLPSRGQMAPVADQEERGEAGELPENEEHEDIVGQHDAEHGALEQKQIGVEPPDQVLAPQIPAGVDDDQQADDQDQEGEEQAVAVDEHAEVEPQLRHPGNLRAGDLAPKHGGDRREEESQGRRGDSPRDQRARVAPGPNHQGWQGGAEERQQHDQGEAHPASAVAVGRQCRRFLSIPSSDTRPAGEVKPRRWRPG
jgi:hypothetical protein